MPNHALSQTCVFVFEIEDRSNYWNPKARTPVEQIAFTFALAMPIVKGNSGVRVKKIPKL